MLKELGQLAGLMKQLPKVKEEFERLQQRLTQVNAEGNAGGGMVRVRVNGKLEVLSCSISEEALQQNDRELLEDLVKGAVNQALDRARQLTAEETAKMTSALGLPTGMGLPGVPLPGA
jgi:DNA-binding YbaB/EbfC family protein